MKLDSFYSRRLHSLLGVIPLGIFLVEHLITNFQAVSGGKEGFNDAVMFLQSIPFVLFLEIFGIWLPLLYHGVYGLFIAFQARHNVNRYSYARNQMFMWQRITGVLTIIFIAWHFSHTRLQVSLGNLDHDQLGSQIHELVTNPIYFALYCIGIVAATFHFCNGMWSFLVSWGITVGPRAQRASSYVWMVAFVILAAMFIIALNAFRGAEFAAISETLLLGNIG